VDPGVTKRSTRAAQRQIDQLVDAVGALVDSAVDRVLLTGERVRSAAEGKSLLTRPEDNEALADNIQRVVVLAVPVVRTFARGMRFARVPWVLVVSTSVSIGLAVRTGVREVQVLAALLAHRLEQASGLPADPALVKKLAVELYLEPKGAPDLTAARLKLPRLARRWAVRGAFGRSTERHARRALDAAGRRDVNAALDAWRSRPPRKELAPVSADEVALR
jgi:hypothetical protein